MNINLVQLFIILLHRQSQINADELSRLDVKRGQVCDLGWNRRLWEICGNWNLSLSNPSRRFHSNQEDASLEVIFSIRNGIMGILENLRNKRLMARAIKNGAFENRGYPNQVNMLEIAELWITEEDGCCSLIKVEIKEEYNEIRYLRRRTFYHCDDDGNPVGEQIIFEELG